MNSSTVLDCYLIELKSDFLFNANFKNITSNIDIPFEIKRIYFLYEVLEGKERGSHAHKDLHQLFIAVSGSFEIEICDSTNKKSYLLSEPTKALVIPPGIWRNIYNFSPNAVCLVLASELYNESDYIRDYNKFVNFKR